MNQSSLMITTIAARSRAFCGTESFLQYVGGCGGLRDHFVCHIKAELGVHNDAEKIAELL